MPRSMEERSKRRFRSRDLDRWQQMLRSTGAKKVKNDVLTGCLVGNEGMIHWLTINNSHPFPAFSTSKFIANRQKKDRLDWIVKGLIQL